MAHHEGNRRDPRSVTESLSLGILLAPPLLFLSRAVAGGAEGGGDNRTSTEGGTRESIMECDRMLTVGTLDLNHLQVQARVLDLSTLRTDGTRTERISYSSFAARAWP